MVNHDGSAHGSPLCRTELQENKARVQSDEFQAAEIELEELCNANHVVTKHLICTRAALRPRNEEIGSKQKSEGLFSFHTQN